MTKLSRIKKILFEDNTSLEKSMDTLLYDVKTKAGKTQDSITAYDKQVLKELKELKGSK